MTEHPTWIVAIGSLILAGPLLGAEDAGPQALAAKIDQLIAAQWSAKKIDPAPLADDAEFMRRVYLELIGRIPSEREARTFLEDRAADKRRQLVERLLASSGYVEHFTNYWRALLLPEAAANFEVQAQVPRFEAWLRKQLTDNVPYDRMVRELITIGFGSTRGQPTNNPANPNDASPLAFYFAKDVKPENLAASTARLFLGVRLECAQCHHHPFAHWKREQFWGYAAFFAGLQRQSLPDGGNGPVREVFDRRELGIPGGTQVVSAVYLDGTEPQWRFRVGSRVTLADWMTSPDNPYFARAAVNRLWGYFFGTGLVEPVDDLEGQNQPSHPELLNELARDFAAHQFDWKYLIRAITASRTYQLTSARTHPSQDDPRRFARMTLKGLTGEQIFDSLVQAANYQFPAPPKPMGDVVNLPAGNPQRTEFLQRFGANQGEKRTEAQTSILQALALMNGSFVAELTSLQGKGTLATAANAKELDTAGRIETLFLATLSRKPTARESARLVAFVDKGGAGGDRKQALADVYWALLNSGEFILDH
jgi:hypothetical protein